MSKKKDKTLKKDLNKHDVYQEKEEEELGSICCDNVYLKKLFNKIDILKKKIEEKKSLIKYLKNKNDDLNKDKKDLELRYMAEIENINKRNEENINKVYKFSLEKFVLQLLPLIDTLKNVVKVLGDKNDLSIHVEGIKLSLKDFLSVIKKFGVVIIDEINVEFNPNFHQAMSVLKSDSVYKNDMVIEILQDGYLINDRLLRPAMVKVLKGRDIK